MTTDLIKALIPLLPRFAEEEGDFYAVKRGDLIDLLCQQTGVDQAVVENTVNLCEILLDSLATLNSYYLQQGEWCFVSFPAQLMALSVLNTLCDPGSRFFEARLGKSNFWKTDSISGAKKEQQYLTLKHFEENRYKQHSKSDAVPIRYIYVAWAVIKVDDHILFYQREDTKKRFDKKAGDYGLVGGRVNQFDFEGSAKGMSEILPILQSADSKQISRILPATLKRELSEEVGLISDTHYSYKVWRELKPYQQVQGAAPNYAITDYFITVFSIELTLEGLCFLQERIKQDERLIWFSIEEMAKGETSDGKIAFINALLNDFAENRQELQQSLLALDSSFSAGYKSVKKNIVLPKDYRSDFLIGVSGKEQAYSINLNSEQFSLLLGLAAHQRAFEFSKLHSDIQLHPYGWIEVSKASVLKPQLLALVDALKEGVLPVEVQQDRYFRLSVAPDNLYFDDSLFSWSIETQPLLLFSIKRSEFNSALGIVCEEEKESSISPSLAVNLPALAKDTLRVDADSVKENYRKSLKIEKGLGLRGLVRGSGDMVKVCCDFVPRSN